MNHAQLSFKLARMSFKLSHLFRVFKNFNVILMYMNVLVLCHSVVFSREPEEFMLKFRKGMK